MSEPKPKCVCGLCAKGISETETCYAGGINKCLKDGRYTKFDLKQCEPDKPLTWIDALVEYWHTHETGNTLCEFLGLTEDEYNNYLKSDDRNLKIILQNEDEKVSKPKKDV